MQQVFQEMLAVHNAAVMSGTHTDFDVANSWDAVWNRVLEMKDWWMDEFERPAGLIVNKVMGIGAVLGGVVQIATTHQHHSPAQLQHQLNMPAKNGNANKPNNNNKKRQRSKGAQKRQTPPAQRSLGAGQHGSPSNGAGGSQLYCKNCKATDHDHPQCQLYDPNYAKGKGGKGGKNGKGGKKGLK